VKSEKTISRNLAIALILLCLLVTLGCEQMTTKSSDAKKAKTDERMKWWRNARFGMFIHWGLYAVPAGEWKGEYTKGAGEWIMNDMHIPADEYEQIAKDFNPVKFDANAWVSLAKNAGMKYIVITSKHHEGFCLWDSKVSEYDVMDATPFKRDILKEMSEACRREGIRLCFYHSIMDWHHPDAQRLFSPKYDTKKTNPNFKRYVTDYLKPQLKELLTGYGPIGVLWFDGEWIRDWTPKLGQDTYNYVRSLQLDVIVNNRVGNYRKGMGGLNKKGKSAGDFGTPEQEVPANGLPGVDWETCMTMNDTWGYKANDDHWKSDKKLIQYLVDITSKGGNFLLNVGPTSEGLIPQASVERLTAMGEWMKVNGESIYGTTAGPLSAVPWGRCTAKSGRLYLHIFDWPASGTLEVPGLRNKVKKAYLLADRKQTGLTVSRTGGVNIVINLPEKPIDPIDTVVVLKIRSWGKRSSNK